MNTFTERTPASDEVNPAPPRGRKLGKLATRARILEVAKQQLETLGFDGTSIRSVAQAAGVATGTVLLHCVDKRDLLHAALFEDLQRSWERARDERGKRSLAHELARIAQAFFDYYAARPVLSRALLRESLFADPPWGARFAAQVADVHRHVASLADRAKQNRRACRARRQQRLRRLVLLVLLFRALGLATRRSPSAGATVRGHVDSASGGTEGPAKTAPFPDKGQK